MEEYTLNRKNIKRYHPATTSDVKRVETQNQVSKCELNKVNEKDNKGTVVENRKPEKIKGIDIYKTASGLSHLNKNDPDRLTFKKNVEYMNSLLAKFKENISTGSVIYDKVLSLPEISDSSYMPDIIPFEFCELMKLAKDELKFIDDPQEDTKNSDIEDNLLLAPFMNNQEADFLGEPTTLPSLEEDNLLLAPFMNNQEADFLGEPTTLSSLENNDVKNFIKDFDIAELEKIVNFNEAYKNKRTAAKIELIKRNQAIFTSEGYIQKKYEEKLNDKSYEFMENDFYVKDREDKAKKLKVRKKYESGQDQINQLEQNQLITEEGKKYNNIEKNNTWKKIKYTYLDIDMNDVISEIDLLYQDVLSRGMILAGLESEESLQNKNLEDLIKIFDNKKLFEDRGPYNNREDRIFALIDYMLENEMKNVEFEDMWNNYSSEENLIKNSIILNLISCNDKFAQEDLANKTIDELKDILDFEISKVASLNERADRQTDITKRTNSPGLERKDLDLSKLETRSEDEDGKAIIEVTGKGKAKLDISSKTLETLFPYYDKKTMSPIQQTGDCYLVNCFVQFMKDPEKRVDMYKYFEEKINEKGEKILTAKYPGGNVSLTYKVDDEGQIINFRPSENALDGSKGFQILEELIAWERIEKALKFNFAFPLDGTYEDDETYEDYLKRYGINQLKQDTRMSVDDKLKEIYDMGIRRLNSKKDEEEMLRSEFSYFVDSGTLEMVAKLLQYDLVQVTDKLEAEDVGIDNSYSGVYDHSDGKGRLWLNHAQSIVGSNHYGVKIQEPNSSNREGFVEYDKILFEALYRYNYNRKSASNFKQ